MLGISKMKGWHKLGCIVVLIGLSVLLIAIPIFAYAFAPTIAELHIQVTSSEGKNAGSPFALEHISALASFYQTVIAVMALITGAVSVVAFFTVRHMSQVAAEEMAVRAAKSVVDDSREFQESIDFLVKQSVREALVRVETLERKVTLISDALSSGNDEEGDGSDLHVTDLGGGPVA